MFHRFALLYICDSSTHPEVIQLIKSEDLISVNFKGTLDLFSDAQETLQLNLRHFFGTLNPLT